MPDALRQPVSAIGDDWLSLARAGEASGVPLRTLRGRAEREARDAKRECRPSLARLDAPPSGRGKRVWWVHRNLHPGLQRSSDDNDSERSSLLTRYPQHQVERAFRKARWLTDWRLLCDARRDSGVTEAELAERVVEQARSIEGDDYAITFRSLQRWYQAYSRVKNDGQIAGVEGLVDKRSIINGARGDDTPDGHRGASVARSPEAIRWLQSRASTLGMGGVGKALVCIYLAYKMAFVQGMDHIGVEHLDAVQDLSMGKEDANHMANVVPESATMRRVV